MQQRVCYENNLVYSVYVLNENVENWVDSLMITNKINNIMSILNILKDICTIGLQIKKNTFPSIAYNVLVVKEF